MCEDAVEVRKRLNFSVEEDDEENDKSEVIINSISSPDHYVNMLPPPTVQLRHSTRRNRVKTNGSLSRASACYEITEAEASSFQEALNWERHSMPSYTDTLPRIPLFVPFPAFSSAVENKDKENTSPSSMSRLTSSKAEVTTVTTPSDPLDLLIRKAKEELLAERETNKDFWSQPNFRPDCLTERNEEASIINNKTVYMTMRPGPLPKRVTFDDSDDYIPMSKFPLREKATIR